MQHRVEFNISRARLTASVMRVALLLSLSLSPSHRTRRRRLASDSFVRLRNTNSFSVLAV